MEETIKLKCNDPGYIKEYYNNNKDKFKKYARKYYEQNVDKIKAINKQSYENNREERILKVQEARKKNSSIVNCDCGSNIVNYMYHRHIKTKKHIKYINACKSEGSGEKQSGHNSIPVL